MDLILRLFWLIVFNIEVDLLNKIVTAQECDATKAQ
jgi:hypothetical protein